MKTQRRGFTLVEMLVVITMIGLLMAMITAALYTARQRARKSRAEVQLRELVSAWTQYYLIYGSANTPGSSFPSRMTRAALEPLIVPDENGFVFLNVTLKKEGEKEDAEDLYLDPWRNPYHVKFNESTPSELDLVSIRASVSFPNRNRE